MNAPETAPETTPATAPAHCHFQAWTGYPLPEDMETLWEEFESLSSPTFQEFAADKAAARDAVWRALEALNATQTTSTQ